MFSFANVNVMLDVQGHGKTCNSRKLQEYNYAVNATEGAKFFQEFLKPKKHCPAEHWAKV